MKIQKIKEKEIKHIRYCRIQFVDDSFSASFWIPSKDHSSNKRTLSLDYANDELVIYDPTDLISEDIQENTVYDYLHQFLSDLIDDDIYFLQEIENQLNKMEKQLFKTKETNTNFDAKLYDLRKTIKAFHAYYNQLIEIINTLQEHSNTTSFDSLEKHVSRLSDFSEHLIDFSSELREMHRSKIETAQNRIMQLLTIVTTIFMPLTLITGWYGMNFKIMPELQTDNGYFIVIGICICLIVLEFIYFKKKKWF